MVHELAEMHLTRRAVIWQYLTLKATQFASNWICALGADTCIKALGAMFFVSAYTMPREPSTGQTTVVFEVHVSGRIPRKGPSSIEDVPSTLAQSPVRRPMKDWQTM